MSYLSNTIGFRVYHINACTFSLQAVIRFLERLKEKVNTMLAPE